MFNYKIVDNQELSNISGGRLGGDVVVGALSGAFQAGQSCIAGGPQAYLICATGGAIVGGIIAFGLRPPK
ncbi:bacteriocin [Streptococcus oralis subsp. tigurinus]|nr:Blp family class II bacteriocin [Streptococcus oralis]ORO44389.1 bacteriocin [Streptococcus oralis subsp. tigurinus]